LSTRPEQDRTVLGLAERQAREIADRTGWSMPEGIEVRVYPDLETFRNATGEPGWVAAHTAGQRIELQPAETLRARGALEPTLGHELTHAILEAHASPGLPLWFREGLAAYLCGGSVGASGAGTDGIARRDDEALARRANASAAARV